MRVLAVLTVRNEASFLLEWLAHHEACGFTDVLVFSNDCEDGTDAMLDRLAAMGRVVHVRNEGPFPQGPQWAALKAADRHPLRALADWVLVLDVDEFVNVHVGDRTVGALLAALPQATAIPLTWRLFGNGGVVAFEDTPVTGRFLRAAPAVLHWPWRAAMVKTLFRDDGSYARLGVHRPRRPDEARMEAQRWVDGAGRPLPARFRTAGVFTALGQDSTRLAQLNHYALGSMEGFVVKCDRGRANRKGAAVDAGYWMERNFSAEEDRSIQRLDSGGRLSDLRSDPVLARLHAGGVAWRRRRFAGLMREEAWRSLFGRLMLSGPSRILTRAEAEAIWRPGLGGAP